MGKDRSFVSQLKKRGGLNVETLYEIASHYTQLNVDWLIMNRGNMLINSASNMIVNEPQMPYYNQKKERIEIPTAFYESLKSIS